MKQKVALFFTGGTISMRVDPKSGGAIPALTGEEILARVDGVNELADFETVDYSLLPGPHWLPEQMLELAFEVKRKLADSSISGVVITHGTDTLEETAYLLDLVLNEKKPIVFVGAMRNSSELSWDGPANVKSAIRTVLCQHVQNLGVVVAMGDQIIAASEVVKTHSESVNTFQSRDFGPLGFIDKDQVIITRSLSHREYLPVKKLETRVEVVKLSAGSDGRVIDFLVNDGMRGIVLEGLGRGNVPPNAMAAIQRAIEAGAKVVISSRCPHGRVLDSYAYRGAGKELTRMGVTLGGYQPSHKLRIRLMVELGER
jgi:L-asparaginase